MTDLGNGALKLWFRNICQPLPVRRLLLADIHIAESSLFVSLSWVTLGDPWSRAVGDRLSPPVGLAFSMLTKTSPHRRSALRWISLHLRSLSVSLAIRA